MKLIKGGPDQPEGESSGLKAITPEQLQTMSVEERQKIAPVCPFCLGPLPAVEVRKIISQHIPGGDINNIYWHITMCCRMVLNSQLVISKSQIVGLGQK